jgi:uncharacterized membrane protein
MVEWVGAFAAVRRARVRLREDSMASIDLDLSTSDAEVVPRKSLVTLTHVIYALHAFSVLTGLLSSALIITAFLSGWPSIIAVIINYIKRSEVRGTWLDSHFGWQIRTFWFALLWLVAGAVVFVTLLGIPVALGIWIATGVWVVYRIARGWMALADRKATPRS